MKSHARGEFAYRSKALGVNVFRSACGATDDLHAPVYVDPKLVDCARCREIARRRAEKAGGEA